MTAGSAPGRLAETTIIGNSTDGRLATGSTRKPTRPASSNATASSVVATGRSMNGREKLTAKWPKALSAAEREGRSEVMGRTLPQIDVPQEVGRRRGHPRCHPGACPRDPSLGVPGRLQRKRRVGMELELLATERAGPWVPGIKPGMARH